jgi:hypothetical protein
MITEANLQPGPTLLLLPSSHIYPRGHRDYHMTTEDIVAFGRCPYRWRYTETDDELPDPEPLDLVRALFLAPERVPGLYVRRPDVFTEMARKCATCGSTSKAKSCTKCGQPRINQPTTRPWAAAAKYCLAWKNEQKSHNLAVIPGPKWDAAALAVARLNEDPDITALRSNSLALPFLSGTWRDTETGLEFPVQSRVDLAPTEGHSFDMALATLATTGDASPTQWAFSTFAKSLHLDAALKHALWNAATGHTRTQHLWCIYERTAPHLTARRRASPDLLASGAQALSLLLAAYARCLLAGAWPKFDLSAPDSIHGWPEVFLEPWMTEPATNNSQFFGLSANLPPKP